MIGETPPTWRAPWRSLTLWTAAAIAASVLFPLGAALAVAVVRAAS
jgi:hypothetical protein